MKASKILKKILVYGFLIIAFVASVFPFYWMITGMTNSSVDVIKGKLTFGDQMINNLKTVFNSYDLGRIFLNSLKISLITMVLSLLISSMAAYGFEFYPSKHRDRIYNIFLLSMMIPFAALMIPLFKLTVKFGMLDKHIAIILTSIASVFLIFFFRQNFKSFPKEIIQAARVDGAGEFKIFYSIVMPSMKSTYAAGAIYSFMTSWNAYLWPLIILQTDKQKTMTLLISSLSSAYFPEYGVIMTAIVIATLPMIVIFFTLQRHFVEGITGSVKQ
ncbi:MAG TPA: lactose ABC transporter permease [Clostridiaceae bacterium]|jgi:lactose/L-arabinose transport system permease protein|nr:lactose ABC transporter permease [Clostridiaceae bacterium]HBG38475.1 lactose ABC transporter permease [Clostridiaceae bacterium]HBN27889.1 lactose ABC transporter permease [Clostridiaceae bacterium]HCL50643.1 lactose ABC transporter permease [Clostridiaceae bacterium]